MSLWPRRLCCKPGLRDTTMGSQNSLVPEKGQSWTDKTDSLHHTGVLVMRWGFLNSCRVSFISRTYIPVIKRQFGHLWERVSQLCVCWRRLGVNIEQVGLLKGNKVVVKNSSSQRGQSATTGLLNERWFNFKKNKKHRLHWATSVQVIGNVRSLHNGCITFYFLAFLSRQTGSTVLWLA